jgi:hypothetical protein
VIKQYRIVLRVAQEISLLDTGGRKRVLVDGVRQEYPEISAKRCHGFGSLAYMVKETVDFGPRLFDAEPQSDPSLSCSLS